MDLREYLLRKNTTVGKFADSIDCSRSYLSQIMRGIKRPGRRVIKDIIAATNGHVTVDEILNPVIWTDPDEQMFAT